MKKRFSPDWIRSTQRRKQRKYRFNAPLNILQKFMGAHLSKELRAKNGTRSMVARKGDTVKILRGQFKGKTGKIDNVDLRAKKVFVTGVELAKKDGTKRLEPISPSNIMITDLELGDKKRQKIVERKRKQNGSKKTP